MSCAATKAKTLGNPTEERVLFHNQPNGDRELSPQDQAYFARNHQRSTLIGTPDGVFRDFMSKGPAPDGDGTTLHSPTDPEQRKQYFGLSDDTVDLGGKQRPASKIINTLGDDRMAPVKLVNETDGKVMWVDMDLAREFGFNVADGNRMTPELNQEPHSCARIASWARADPGGHQVIEGYADTSAVAWVMHKGRGVQHFCRGSTRTSKAWGARRWRHRLPTETIATHTAARPRAKVCSKRRGLVSDNMFTGGGTRILSVIDVGDNTKWQDGGQEPRALIVRVGNQLRPAHIFDEVPTADTPKTFERIARESGILVADQGGQPDFRETMINALDKQALLSAENYRFRTLHGSVTTSNMEWDGGMLDHGTTTAVSRTERARVVGWEDQYFGNEHMRRAEELNDVYAKLQQGLRADPHHGGSPRRSISPRR